MAIRIIDRLRSYLDEHPEGGTVAELTEAIGAKHVACVAGVLHKLRRNGEVIRKLRSSRPCPAYHYQLPTDRLILALAGV